MSVKTIGYILAIVGLLLLALTFSQVRTALKVTLPEKISTQTLTIISVVIIIAGIALVTLLGRKSHGSEVPIYRGNQIVGYRKV